MAQTVGVQWTLETGCRGAGWSIESYCPSPFCLIFKLEEFQVPLLGGPLARAGADTTSVLTFLLGPRTAPTFWRSCRLGQRRRRLKGCGLQLASSGVPHISLIAPVGWAARQRA